MQKEITDVGLARQLPCAEKVGSGGDGCRKGKESMWLRQRWECKQRDKL